MTRRPARTLALLCAVLSLAACSSTAGRQPTAAWHAPQASGAGGGGPIAAGPSDSGVGGPAASGQQARPTPPPPPPGSAAPPPVAPDPSESESGSPPEAPPGGDGLLRRTGSAGVALTFDDGPSQYTPQILALLRSYGIKATFCLIGVNVRANPGYVQQIVADGHTLCNHSWRHDLKLGSKPVDQIRKDLQMTSDEIHKAVPDAQIKYYRQPGGMWTPNVIAVAKELGMAPLHWSADPMDWNTKRWAVGATMTNHIVGVVEHNASAGAIVLSHDGGGNRDSTIAAYRTLIPWLKQRFQLIAMPVS